VISERDVRSSMDLLGNDDDDDDEEEKEEEFGRSGSSSKIDNCNEVESPIKKPERRSKVDLTKKMQEETINIPKPKSRYSEKLTIFDWANNYEQQQQQQQSKSHSGVEQLDSIKNDHDSLQQTNTPPESPQKSPKPQKPQRKSKKVVMDRSNLKTCTVLYNYSGDNPDELHISKGDMLFIKRTSGIYFVRISFHFI